MESTLDQYTDKAEHYSKLKERDWVRVVERPTVLRALGDLRNLTCMDMACGSGYYARQMKLLGAAEVIGVDYSPQMIELARSLDDLSITYLTQDCERLEELGMPEYFDVVFGGWMIPYIPSVERVSRFAQNLRSVVKPGGRTVQLFGNENRFSSGNVVDLMDAMGQRFEANGHVPRDGDPYKVIIGATGDSPGVELINHYYTHPTIKKCFMEAGFGECKFHSIVLQAKTTAEREKYREFVEDPLITVFEAKNV
ncbi:uncharacterized protein HI_0912-like [Paramacrobiotus metropolitanus]|uniref:uncharacterized protein HI_0912-like n=1 Tax=Paramacrobiotus metropolitanus TaxID=2943436 RepID=UPI002445926D|nr:uncharacterized protein HI_0912-like [Paramacrobiotus metropolitanus]